MSPLSNVTLKEHLETAGTYLRLVHDEHSTGIWSQVTRSGTSSSTLSGQDAELYWARQATEAHSALQSWTERNEFASGQALSKILTSSSLGAKLLYELANAIDMLMLIRWPRA